MLTLVIHIPTTLITNHTICNNNTKYNTVYQ